MPNFNGTKLNPGLGKMLLIIFGFLALSACASTRTFEDVGVYKGENYTIDITRADSGLFREYYISINGDLVLTIDRAAIDEAPCEKMSLYVNRCTFDTQYEGKAVRIVQEADAQMFQQNIYYNVYFDEMLIRRVITPLI